MMFFRDHTSDFTIILFKDWTRSSFELGTPCKVNPHAIRKKKIRSILLSYAKCFEQDNGITPIAEAFGCNSRLVITKIPDNFEVFEDEDGFKSLKFGKPNAAPLKLKSEIAGIASYWDSDGFEIMANPNYAFLIDKIKKMFKKKHLRFINNKTTAENLVFLSI